MSAKQKKGLGRGFDSLIPIDLFDDSFDPTAEQDEQISQMRSLAITEVVADPDQPRAHFDESGLAELAASIQAHGILQPIVVTPFEGKFMIVAGERRYRAAKIAGETKLPAIVRTLSDQHKLELSLIENIQRRDLNPIETATAYAKLRDQFNLTLEQIGERVGGRSISAISNTLRLLRLPTAAKDALLAGKLSEGQTRPLIGCDESMILALLPTIIKEEWSARRIEQYVNQVKGAAGAGTKPRAESQQLQRDVSQALSKQLSLPVRVKTDQSGGGQIVISFKSSDELDKLKHRFK